MKKTKRRTISAALKPFLERWPPRRGLKTPPKAHADLDEFQRRCGPRSRGRNREERERILQAFGKPPEELSLQEFRNYHAPNFSARFYLKELWPQLTRWEQALVIRLNEWAFIFPATFQTERDFLMACASRLRRFFKRRFQIAEPIQDECRSKRARTDHEL